MSQHDSISLCREQRVDVFGADGRKFMIVDHPLNSPLVGIPAQVAVVREADFCLQPGNKTIAVYTAKAGGSLRIATASAMSRRGGSLSLTDWLVETGFAHEPTAAEGCTAHRVVKSG